MSFWTGQAREQFPSALLRAGLGGLLNSYYRKAA
jgi:hypothetical protein